MLPPVFFMEQSPAFLCLFVLAPAHKGDDVTHCVNFRNDLHFRNACVSMRPIRGRQPQIGTLDSVDRTMSTNIAIQMNEGWYIQMKMKLHG